MTVRGDFVAQGDDPANNLWKHLGQSAHHKKGGPGVVVIQKTKQDVELTEDVAGRRWQAPTPQPAGAELVPVFQINGQNIRDCPIQLFLPRSPGWHRNHTSVAG